MVAPPAKARAAKTPAKGILPPHPFVEGFSSEGWLEDAEVSDGMLAVEEYEKQRRIGLFGQPKKKTEQA